MISLAVFKSRDAARLMGSQILSQVCDKMMSLGLVWVIAAEISPTWITWFLAAGALPHILMSWSSGQMIARFSALRVVIVTDAVRGLIYLVAGLSWLRLNHSDALPTLMVITVVANFASALFNPAILSLPGQLREKVNIQQLTAGIDACFTASAVIGPVTAALLYPWIGLSGLFIVNGLSYLLAALLESGIQIAKVAPPVESLAKSLAESLHESRSPFEILKSDPFLIFTLSAFFLMNLALTPMLAFLPLFSTQIFRGSISTLVSLETALGIGTIIGSLGLSVLRTQTGNGKKTVLAIRVVALAYLAFSLNRSPLRACIYLAILGVALSVVNISMVTLLQTRPRMQDVPTVMSIVNLISLGVMPFSMALVATLLLRFDLKTIAPALALVLILLAVLTATYRPLREAP